MQVRSPIARVKSQAPKRSSPTTWVGDFLKVIGTRTYYSACKYENEVYRVWDVVMLNSDVEPFPLGRIVAMWEQAKKKWLTINWYYRATDLQRSIDERQRNMEIRDDDDISKKTKPPSKKKSEIDEETVKETLEYLSTMDPQEVIVSSHKDDNYPSTLFRKISVKHLEEIPNLEEFKRRDRRTNLFYQKQIDMDTFKMSNAIPTHPTAIDAIVRARRNTSGAFNNKPLVKAIPAPRKRKHPTRSEMDDTSPPHASSPARTPSPSPPQKRLHIEPPSVVTSSEIRRPSVGVNVNVEVKRTDELDLPSDVPNVQQAMQNHLSNIHKMTEKTLKFLEEFVKEQHEQMSTRLLLVEQLTKKNNRISSDIYSQIQDSPKVARSIKMNDRNPNSRILTPTKTRSRSFSAMEDTFNSMMEQKYATTDKDKNSDKHSATEEDGVESVDDDADTPYEANNNTNNLPDGLEEIEEGDFDEDERSDLSEKF
eukprot:TRINITY_DN4718_c0_g1_i3.p1 TRINITY_DN4718_c0_g1~~TRINITY_DN4718_c0_g1_i3.p1  ORF type:complete len:480 (+),score=107.21 TRINITY_DN4718_c0_g1_i3:21-1460(+)